MPQYSAEYSDSTRYIPIEKMHDGDRKLIQKQQDQLSRLASHTKKYLPKNVTLVQKLRKGAFTDTQPAARDDATKIIMSVNVEGFRMFSRDR